MSTKTTTPAKFATVLRDYTTEAYGYTITVPAGALVSNSTACGPDDNYRFWVGYGAEIKKQHPVNMPNGRTVAPMMLLHDLEYRGINVPAEYCSEWN